MADRTQLTVLWERFGPRSRDLACVAVGLLTAFAEARARRSGSTLAWSLVGATAAIGALTLWWRRRHPVAVAVAGVVVLAATGLPLVAAVGLFTLAVDRRDRVLAAVTVVAIAVFTLTSSVDNDIDWTSLVVLSTVEAGFFVAAGAYVGARRDLVAALRERAERAEADQDARAEQARLAERARIAREMHDVLAHKVSLIALQAGALEVRAAPTADQVATGAAVIRATAREAMEDLRDVLGVLRVDAADGSDTTPTPRAEDIARVVDASRAAGVAAELRMDVVDLPDAVARTAHRVVREGLTNVHKHARGAATVVTLSGDATSGVTVEVVNRRPAGHACLLPGAGVGLLGLEERVTLLGGSLHAGPGADGGWRMTAWMPWGHS